MEKKLLLLIPGEGKKFSPLNESLVHNWTLAILHLRGKQFWQENIRSDISLAAFYNKTVIWSRLAWNVRGESDGDGFTDKSAHEMVKGSFQYRLVSAYLHRLPLVWCIIHDFLGNQS